MTELEQARAHLLECQDLLHAARKLAWCIDGQRMALEYEKYVLAALSWVWDAQERALSQPFDDYETWIKTPDGRCFRVVEGSISAGPPDA